MAGPQLVKTLGFQVLEHLPSKAAVLSFKFKTISGEHPNVEFQSNAFLLPPDSLRALAARLLEAAEHLEEAAEETPPQTH
jgi:hypothetical protein